MCGRAYVAISQLLGIFSLELYISPLDQILLHIEHSFRIWEGMKCA